MNLRSVNVIYTAVLLAAIATTSQARDGFLFRSKDTTAKCHPEGASCVATFDPGVQPVDSIPQIEKVASPLVPDQTVGREHGCHPDNHGIQGIQKVRTSIVCPPLNRTHANGSFVKITNDQLTSCNPQGCQTKRIGVSVEDRMIKVDGETVHLNGQDDANELCYVENYTKPGRSGSMLISQKRGCMTLHRK